MIQRYNLTGVPAFYPGIDTSDFTNDTYSCDAGWYFDTSQYKSSVAMEVSRKSTDERWTAYSEIHL